MIVGAVIGWLVISFIGVVATLVGVGILLISPSFSAKVDGEAFIPLGVGLGFLYWAYSICPFTIVVG